MASLRLVSAARPLRQSHLLSQRCLRAFPAALGMARHVPAAAAFGVAVRRRCRRQVVRAVATEAP